MSHDSAPISTDLLMHEIRCLDWWTNRAATAIAGRDGYHVVRFALARPLFRLHDRLVRRSWDRRHT